MGKLKSFWQNYKVLIVMGTSLGLIHWGWYTVKSNPAFRKSRELDYIPTPGIVAYVAPEPPPPPPPAKPATPAPAAAAAAAPASQEK